MTTANTTNDTAVKALTASLATLEGRLDTLNSEMLTAESAMAMAQADVGSLNAKFGSMVERLGQPFDSIQEQIRAAKYVGRLAERLDEAKEEYRKATRAVAVLSNQHSDLRWSRADLKTALDLLAPEPTPETLPLGSHPADNLLSGCTLPADTPAQEVQEDEDEAEASARAVKVLADFEKAFPGISGAMHLDVWSGNPKDVEHLHLGDVAEGGTVGPYGDHGADFNSWNYDPEETRYVGGIHKDIRAWLEEREYMIEWYDGGTVLAYYEG